jgi:hydroxyethylthiazole kinase
MEREWVEKIGDALKAARSQKPLVNHITNYVTVNDCANITLAIGASPIMADDIRESAEITSISSALVLNTGTLAEQTIQSMLAAGKKANELKIPVVLDPVGVGASKLRNQTVERILHEVKISVLRGNISEIRYIAGFEASTKGVDASDADMSSGLEAACTIVKTAARKYGCTVAATGETDIISDGHRTIMIKNGTRLLASVTGTGCMCTSLVGAFSGVTKDPMVAAAGGALCMGIAGEIAEEKAGKVGTGSFHIAIIDAVSLMDAETLMERAKIYETRD